MYRLIFFGTPEFAATILKGLIEDSRYDICGVVTRPDKPVGRKGILTPSPVKKLAEKNNIPTYDVDSMIKIIESVRQLRADLGVVAAYGKILPQELLEIPQAGFLNVHPSLLPKHRGASPIRAPILEGEPETGVTIIKMDTGIDTGPVVTQARIPVDPNETARTLTSKLATLGDKLLRKEIPSFVSEKRGLIDPTSPREQDKSGISYTKLLRRDDGKIHWSKPDKEIERMIRAFDPWPGTWTTLKDLLQYLRVSTTERDSSDDTRRVKILKAHLSKEGRLIIDRLQIEGKSPIVWEEFRSGYLSPRPSPES